MDEVHSKGVLVNLTWIDNSLSRLEAQLQVNLGRDTTRWGSDLSDQQILDFAPELHHLWVSF